MAKVAKYSFAIFVINDENGDDPLPFKNVALFLTWCTDGLISSKLPSSRARYNISPSVDKTRTTAHSHYCTVL